jgi:hypothetical protein
MAQLDRDQRSVGVSAGQRDQDIDRVRGDVRQQRTVHHHGNRLLGIHVQSLERRPRDGRKRVDLRAKPAHRSDQIGARGLIAQIGGLDHGEGTAAKGLRDSPTLATLRLAADRAFGVLDQDPGRFVRR